MTRERIVFDSADLAPSFRLAGIDPASITAAEWSRFVDAFLDGTGWTEVANEAAFVIAEERREA